MPPKSRLVKPGQYDSLTNPEPALHSVAAGLFFLQIRSVLLLIGQPVPFLRYFQQRRAVLPGQEALDHETAITRKPPILFRSTRHNRRPVMNYYSAPTGVESA